MVLFKKETFTKGSVCFVFASVTVPLTFVSWANVNDEEKRNSTKTNSFI